MMEDVGKGVPDFTEDDILKVETLENENKIPLMYAITLKDNKGFVVSSASMKERPILAYNNEGTFSFENIEDYPGVVEWVYLKYLKINHLISQNVPAESSVIREWLAVNPLLIKSNNGGITTNNSILLPENSFTKPDIQTYGPLLTTRWGQSLSSNPNSSHIGYNNFVRYNNCSSGVAPAGCVATAMGQILKYYSYPNIFNISEMPNFIDYINYNQQNSINVAYLLKDIGYKVNMNYSCTGSSASSYTAVFAFQNHYSYNTSSLVPLSKAAVIDNIINNKPVYLDGCGNRKIKRRPVRLGVGNLTIGQTVYSYDRCHAWVAEGYEVVRKKIRLFAHTYNVPIAKHIYMNWGWNGYCNGWFDYENWEIITQLGVAVDNYQYKQRMIYDINPKNN